MPYNLNIPGQVTKFQLEAIETVATLIPPGGQMVEVGSLFGASSWCWAKSVDPTVTVFCVDPWVGNRGVKGIEDRHGIKYGLEQFKIFTADCPNIVPKQGFSPKDFLDWNEGPIDLYYEDAVHVDPILAQNLEFWSKRLKPEGILCGDDYRNRFPDVQNGAARLAAEFGRELITVENFWCLLPNAAPESNVGQAKAKLRSLSENYIQACLLMGPHAALFLSAGSSGADGVTPITVNVTQSGVVSWPEHAADGPLEISLLLYKDSTCQDDLGQFGAKMDNVDQLICDIPHQMVIEVNVPEQTRSVFAVATANSSDGTSYELGRRILEL